MLAAALAFSAHLVLALNIPHYWASEDCVLQIEMGSTNVRVGSTIFGARDYAKWTERPRDKEQDPGSDSG